jgi:hypothetical protein
MYIYSFLLRVTDTVTFPPGTFCTYCIRTRMHAIFHLYLLYSLYLCLAEAAAIVTISHQDGADRTRWHSVTLLDLETSGTVTGISVCSSVPQTNTVILRRINDDCLLPNPLQLIMHSTIYALRI